MSRMTSPPSGMSASSGAYRALAAGGSITGPAARIARSISGVMPAPSQPGQRRILVEAPILHDAAQALAVLQDPYVGRRVAVDQQQIGQEARLDLAQLVAHAHQLTAQQGRGRQRLFRRVAEQVDEKLEVARIAA